MKKVMDKIKTMIQWGTILKKTDDSGRDQVAQVGVIGGVPAQVVLVYPYGITANAPIGANVLGVNIGGSSKAKVGIPQMMENRPLNLKEWEVKVGNFKTKAHVFFSENGDIKLSPQSADSEDWAVQFTALKAAFDQLKNDHDDLVSALNSIVLPVAGATPSGPNPVIAGPPPAPVASPSTADMSGAKVEKVRLP